MMGGPPATGFLPPPPPPRTFGLKVLLARHLPLDWVLLEVRTSTPKSGQVLRVKCGSPARRRTFSNFSLI